MKLKRLLIIEDDSTLKMALFRALTKFGYSVTTATSTNEARTWLKSQTVWDAVLLDLQLPDGSGMELLSDIKNKVNSPPVIVMTGNGSVENAVAATQKGASQFLVKPTSLDDIINSLNSTIQSELPPTTATHSVGPATKPHSFINIIGQSQGIQQVLELASRVADSDATILIHGESGTGKELVARTIHQLSPRKQGPFVAINCGAIPAELLESELFGHVKGAFTGAISNRVGRFEMADGGILFLDEIGDMSPTLQVKILRAIQEKTLEPVGGARSVQVNVQIIAATHINLEKAVADGKFREDLFYRLNVIPINLPALRERRSDVPLLIQHFIKHFSSKRRECITGFSPEALGHLMAYGWPGNIRELENLVERLMIIKGRGLVETKDLPAKYLSKSATASVLESPPAQLDLPSTGLDFNAAVDSFENNLILRALEMTNWNRNQAAQLLRLNRTTLVEKMKKKGLRQPEESLLVESSNDFSPQLDSPLPAATL